MGGAARIIEGAVVMTFLMHVVQGSTVFRVDGSCYVAPNIPSKTLYVTERLDPLQVEAVNTNLTEPCPFLDTWLVGQWRPPIPSLGDYLASYAKNGSYTAARGTRRRRSVLRRNGPSTSPRRHLHRSARRRGHRGSGQPPRSSRVRQASNPYPFAAVTNARPVRQRFQHYKAFFNEVQPNLNQKQGAHALNLHGRAARNSNYIDNHRVLSSYSLQIVNNSLGSHVTNLQPQYIEQPLTSQNQNPSDNYLSNNDKRHIASNNLRSLDTNLAHGQIENNDHYSGIPETIIKDGQIFHRHDVPESHENSKESIFEEISSDSDNVLPLVEDQNSLIFSQAFGSSGKDGTFQAEAESRSQQGELTHSVVEGGSDGASASASAIGFNQQALAQVSVHPISRSSVSANDKRGDIEDSNLSSISQSEIEDMMRRNGLIGFAMASVTARKKGNMKQPSSLGDILPGYSVSSNQIGNEISEGLETAERHSMLDSIVEKMHSPPENGILIDEGGLEVGYGDQHSESEVEQIKTEKFNDREDGNFVGLATHNQGIPGYPPNVVINYSDLYDNFEQYDLYPPVYFPDRNNNHEEILQIPDLPLGTNPNLSDSLNQLPTELQSGVQYPIVKGDVPAGHTGHMIVDDTLSSYFPPPRAISDRSESYFGSDAYTSNHDHNRLVTTPLFIPTNNSLLLENDIQLVQPTLDRTYFTSALNSDNEVHVDQIPFINENNYITEELFNEQINLVNNIETKPAYKSNKEYERRKQNESRFSLLNIKNENIYSDDTKSNNIVNNFENESSNHNYSPDNSGFDYHDTYHQFFHVDDFGSGDGDKHSDNLMPNNIYENSHLNHHKSEEGGNTHSDNYISEIGYGNINAHDLGTGGRFNMDLDDFPREENKYPGIRNRDNAYSQSHNTDEKDYIDGESYDSSYETSSQSSSQSSQSVYTASHHYTYQHGSNEREIGNRINTHIPEATRDNKVNGDPGFKTNAYNSGIYAPGKSETLISPFSPPAREQDLSRRVNGPSGSKDVQMMRIVAPGRVGSTFSIPSSNPNLSEIKVVMAKAPTKHALQRRTDKILKPGDKIPGTDGYTIPPGFRGRLVLGSSSMMQNTKPHMIMPLSNQIIDHKNINNMLMSLSSSSSASSDMSGTALATSSSAQMIGKGSLSASSASMSQRMANNNAHVMQENRPIYSFQQTIDGNYANPFHKQHPEALEAQQNTPRLRSQSWSNWRSNDWNDSNGENEGSLASQSSFVPSAQDCGYYTMQCFMAQNSFQTNQICRPTHVALPCCC